MSKEATVNNQDFPMSYAMHTMRQGKSFNARASLRPDESKRYTGELTRVLDPRLVLSDMMASNGLVIDLNNLGVITVSTETISKMTEADVSMSLEPRSSEDITTYGVQDTPVPVVQKDFRINTRLLEASRTTGAPLSTEALTESGIRVADKIEDGILNGFDIGQRGNRIMGLANTTAASTGSLTAAWDNEDQRNIFGDVNDMVKDMVVMNRDGPFVLLVSRNYYIEMQKDYNKNYPSRTFEERIEADALISEVVAVPKLADGTVILLDANPNTVDLVWGARPRNIAWSNSPFENHFVTFAAVAPRIKVNAAGETGIVRYTA